MKASARPVDRERNDSATSFCVVIVMPRFCSVLSLCRIGSEVEPALVTTVRPLRSAKSLMPESFFVNRRVPMTKIVLEKATCFSRSTLFVVVVHSISIVPFCSSGIRFCGVIATVRTVRFGRFSFFLMPSTIANATSCE
jgi:hypothetical protein